MTDNRQATLEHWLAATLGGPVRLRPASTDASFRRYWRLDHGDDTLIAMDAPPPVEDTGRFARLARRLRAIGLNTPAVLAEDHERGFLLLGDLGTRPYLDELDDRGADALYRDAIAALLTMQTAGPLDGLPAYDAAFLRREVGLFQEWLVDGLLRLDPCDDERALLDAAGRTLIDTALEQPVVFVHRDYHSRNLMVCDGANPGILDFQDAVAGPVSYDLVSLLKDCYIDWPRARVLGWVGGWLDQAAAAGLLTPAQQADFPRWFDLMGAQRHLKAAGIFARLSLRDGKHGYLGDLPRTLGYVVEVGALYPQLADLGAFIRERVLPAVERLPQR